VPAVPLRTKIACIVPLIEAQAGTREIQAEYYAHTGIIPNARQVRDWRKQLGHARKLTVHVLPPLDPLEIEALRVQGLVKKYWIPTDGNHLLC